VSSTFATINALIGMARQHGVDIKPTLLRVLTDLYVRKPRHESAETDEFQAVALRLITAVDPPTRAIVAAKLHAHPDTPAAVLSALAAAQASDAQVRDLSDRRAGLAQGFPGHETLSELSELFFAAGTMDRRLILENLEFARFSIGLSPVNASADTSRRLEQAALARRTADFVRELAKGLGIAQALAERIVVDISGEALVAAARALELPADVLQRVLLFVNPEPGRSVERVFALTALYEKTSREAAAQLVALWQAIAPARNEHNARIDHRRRAQDDRAAGAARVLPARAPQRTSWSRK
jgi:uncharacterized protein (DUF2336 family)